MTTVTTVSQAVSSIFAAAEVLRANGVQFDFRIQNDSSSQARSEVMGVLSSIQNLISNNEAAEASEEAAEAAQTAAASGAAQARIEAVTGTTIYANRTERTSSGFKVCDRTTRVVSFRVNEATNYSNTPSGWVNVYAESIGTDIHSTKDKAEEYASSSVVATLPVYAV